MSDSLFNLSRTLWISEVGTFLAPRDWLCLRATNRSVLTFVASLCPGLAAEVDRRVVQLQQTISPDVHSAESRIATLEPLRQHILSVPFPLRSLAEVSSLARPPSTIFQALEVVVGLKLPGKTLSWIEIKAELRKSTFISELKSQFSVCSPVAIPPEIRKSAFAQSVNNILMCSKSCADLFQLAMDYISLQDEYNRDETIEWFAFQQKVQAIEQEKRVYLRLVQGMPATLQKGRKTGKKAEGRTKGLS